MDLALVWPNRHNGNLKKHTHDTEALWDRAELDPVRSNTFEEIDHEIISTVILLPSADSFKKGCESMCTKLTACSSLPRKKCG